MIGLYPTPLSKLEAVNGLKGLTSNKNILYEKVGWI